MDAEEEVPPINLNASDSALVQMWGAEPRSQPYFADNPHSTERNQRESPLLRLPAELRHNIYEQILGGKLYLVKLDRPRFNLVTKCEDSSFSDDATILRVCRQIHYEARLLPFQLNVFDIRGLFSSHFLGLPAKSLNRLKHITSIRIDGYFAEARGGKLVARFPLWFQRKSIFLARFPDLKRVHVRALYRCGQAPPKEKHVEVERAVVGEIKRETMFLQRFMITVQVLIDDKKTVMYLPVVRI